MLQWESKALTQVIIYRSKKIQMKTLEIDKLFYFTETDDKQMRTLLPPLSPHLFFLSFSHWSQKVFLLCLFCFSLRSKKNNSLFIMYWQSETYVLTNERRNTHDYETIINFQIHRQFYICSTLIIQIITWTIANTTKRGQYISIAHGSLS